MPVNPALDMLRKALDGLNLSKEYKNYFDDSHYVNTLDQFYGGGKSAYQGSHFRLEGTQHLPDTTLCFRCSGKEWERDTDQRTKTEALLSELGIESSFFEEQEKVDALLNHYDIVHSFVPMREHEDDKRYHAVLITIDANQPQLLEKLTGLFNEKVKPMLSKVHAEQNAQERLVSAMHNYAAAAGYPDPYHTDPLTIDERGEHEGEYSIICSKYDNRSPSPELRDALGGFLIETGLKQLPIPGSIEEGWDQDGFYFGKLTTEHCYRHCTH